MPTMFSSLPNKKIPASLNECMESNPTASHLQHWADRIEEKGISSARFVGIIGGLLTVVLFFATLTANIFVAILVAVILGSITYTIASNTYTSYHIRALDIGATASIVQSATVSAAAALYTAAHSGTPLSAPQSDGHAAAPAAPSRPAAPKSSVMLASAAPSKPRPMPFWTCKECNKLNSSGDSVCAHCGAGK